MKDRACYAAGLSGRRVGGDGRSGSGEGGGRRKQAGVGEGGGVRGKWEGRGGRRHGGRGEATEVTGRGSGADPRDHPPLRTTPSRALIKGQEGGKHDRFYVGAAVGSIRWTVFRGLFSKHRLSQLNACMLSVVLPLYLTI